MNFTVYFLFLQDTQACLVGNGITVDNDKASTSNFKRCGGFAELNDGHSLLKNFDKVFQEEVKENFEMRCLQDMLEESQSDSPISFYSNVDSIEASDSEVTLSLACILCGDIQYIYMCVHPCKIIYLHIFIPSESKFICKNIP